MDLLTTADSEIAVYLEKFLAQKLTESGLDGFILGLSGGIDSAVVACIAVKAVGKEKIIGLIMPYIKSSAESENDARLLASQLGIKVEKIDISPMINGYYQDISLINAVRAGNKMARERMSILFDKASQYNCLVLGTSNRTEICLGYGTWYGDMACSVNPIGMLYKTQVRQLARYYKVPDSIINKAPTADLWPGQTDEGELELEYETVDRLLYMMIEQDVRSRDKLNASGFGDKFIDRAVSLLNKFYFKRHLPEIADLELKPIPDKILIS